MEKSMVHELNPLITSNVQFNRSSFIHTVYETDFNQLRKSRIQNLPNYRKEDLSGKINFVAVFQAIEIERLSVQIQSLRVKIKDYERQFCNYENYEVQIRQLTEKCHSYEMQRQDHQEAMEKMHKICQQLYNQLEEMRARYADIDLSLKEKYRLEKERSDMLMSEVEKWKARYNASQKSKAKQLEDMRLMLQTQRKSMLQRQLRQLQIKHESQRSMMESELRKARQSIDNKNKQLQRTRQQLQESRINQSELRQYQSRLDEYQDKLMMITQENMRLNELLRMKKEQIQQLKNNERNLENKLSGFVNIQEDYSLSLKKTQQQENQLRDWSQKYMRLEAENSRNLILSNKAEQYERLLDDSGKEMEKMNTIIRQKISDIDKLKNINQRLAIELQEAKNIQQKLKQHQNHIEEITNENQRLDNLLRNRLEEIQTWKLKHYEMEAKLPLLQQSQNQCKSLQEKLAAELTTRAIMSEIIAKMENDLEKAAQIQESLINQKASNKDLQRQIQRLNSSVRSLSSQNKDLVKKMQELDQELKENSDIKSQLQECKQRINKMTQELDRINGVLHQKLQQVAKLKQNFNSVSINTTRYKQIEEQFVINLQQTQKLVLKLDESRRENQCVSQKLMNAEMRCKKLEGEILINNQEKERLVGIINQKKNQLQDLVSRLEKADQRIGVLQMIEQQHKQAKNHITELQQLIKQVQTRYTKQTKRSEQFSNQIQFLRAELMKLRNESNFTKQFISQFMNIKKQSCQKDALIKQLIHKISVVEKCIMVLKQQNQNNFKSMSQHHQRIGKVAESVDGMFLFMERVCQLQKKIDNLAEQNLKLESSVNIMNIELAESKYTTENSYNREGQHKINISSPKIKQSSPIPYENTSISFEKSHQSKNMKQSAKKNIDPYTVNNSTTLNYYESQVRQLYGVGFQPTSSSVYSSNLDSSKIYYQNPAQSAFNQYGSKARPVSNQQSSSTYTYHSSYNNLPSYSNNYRVSNNLNSDPMIHLSNLSPTSNYTSSNFGSSASRSNAYTTYTSKTPTHGSNNFGQSNFSKQKGKFTVSEIGISPELNEGKRFTMSPVRFLG